MQIKHEKPPIYDAIIANKMRPHNGIVYTYGNTIYNPSGLNLPQYIIEHEETHSIQQGDNPDAWWKRYLKDKYFRIEQEIEAYINQYVFMCQMYKDRNQRDRILRQLAGILSGPVYGNIISESKAYWTIRDRSNVK